MLKPIILDKLPFPEILWHKPVNVYQKRGRVLIIGGESEIKKTLLFCEALSHCQIQKIHLGYPDSYQSLYQKILPSDFHLPLPSSQNKTLSIRAYETIEKEMENYDLIVVGLGLSKNQETQNLIKKISGLDFPILLTKEGLETQLEIFQTRTSLTISFLDYILAAALLDEKAERIREYPLQNLEKLLESKKDATNVIVLANQKVFIGTPGRMAIASSVSEQVVLLSLISCFWSQNIKKPFESATTASYIAKIWQENFATEISGLKKAINLAEKENFR